MPIVFLSIALGTAGLWVISLPLIGASLGLALVTAPFIGSGVAVIVALHLAWREARQNL